jgi:phosphatidylglycerol---prolipoprotein diacylglyceryl transferase
MFVAAAPLVAIFQFNIWSFAVPAAVASGYWLSVRRVREARLDVQSFRVVTQWAIAIGLVVSHVVEILLYRRDRLATEGFVAIAKVWDGMSSYGGFFGAVAVFAVYYRGIKRRRWWGEADALVEGLMLAWVFGRLGCTVSGDHPGPRTDFLLAYPYPDGGRHNNGLYEMLFTLLVIVPTNLLLHRRRQPVGTYLAIDCLIYGAGRFALDFLRATDRPDSDPRYFGLTLGHYCSAAVFVFGLWLLRLSRSHKLDSAAAPAVS